MQRISDLYTVYYLRHCSKDWREDIDTTVLGTLLNLSKTSAKAFYPSERQTSSASNSSDLRLNHIQVNGTHNSYHREPQPFELDAFNLIRSDPQNYYYSHASLGDQLSYQGVRSLELDLWPDPNPGLYADPLIRRITAYNATSADSWSYTPIIEAIDTAWNETMHKEGTKVMHTADADVRAVCNRLMDCLALLRDWSNENPRHIPIIVDLEFKLTDSFLEEIGGVTNPDWNSSTLGTVDSEIKSVLGADANNGTSKVIIPDDIRRSGLTLEESVLQYGWPTLEDSRGKFLFFMDNNPASTTSNDGVRDAYIANHTSLEGRMIWTNSVEGQPDAAMIKENDPTGDYQAEIQRLVKKGYLIRSRADEPLSTVLSGDTSRRELAFSSGAQVVSTDFPVPGMASRWESDYFVRLNGSGLVNVRCNPVNAPADCSDDSFGEGS